MKRMIAIAASVAAMGILSAPAYAADYLPSGVQNNVSVGTVTGGGWTLCFSESYGAYGSSVASVLAGCSSDRLMLAGRQTGSDNIMALAQAAFADVTFDTGTGNVTHNANGVEWYFSDDYSWGFAPGGSAVFRNSCDTVDASVGPTSGQRLCWHTGNGLLEGGWRVGAAAGLNNSTAYERMIFAFTGNGTGAVPEPSTWALLLFGFAGIGATMRTQKRRQNVTVRYA